MYGDHSLQMNGTHSHHLPYVCLLADSARLGRIGTGTESTLVETSLAKTRLTNTLPISTSTCLGSLVKWAGTSCDRLGVQIGLNSGIAFSIFLSFRNQG